MNNTALMVATAIPEQFCQVTDHGMSLTEGWLAEAAVIPDEIVSDSQLELACEIMRSGKKLLSEGEACRVKVKDPFLNAGRKIDQMHKDWCRETTVQVQRILAAISRRQMKLLQEQRAREAAAKAEAARLEQERLKAIQAANAEGDCDKRRELSQQAQALSAQKQEVIAAAVPMLGGSGTLGKPKPIWVGTVVDPAAVYRVRPDLCDVVVSQARLNEAIRGGLRSLDGVVIMEEGKIR